MVIYLANKALMSWDSIYGYIFNNHHYHYQGRAVKFHQLEKKMSRPQRERFFVQGLARKVLGLGVLGLEYRVLRLKMMFTDHSNCSQLKFILRVDIQGKCRKTRTVIFY